MITVMFLLVFVAFPIACILLFITAFLKLLEEISDAASGFWCGAMRGVCSILHGIIFFPNYAARWYWDVRRRADDRIWAGLASELTAVAIRHKRFHDNVCSAARVIPDELKSLFQGLECESRRKFPLWQAMASNLRESRQITPSTGSTRSARSSLSKQKRMLRREEADLCVLERKLADSITLNGERILGQSADNGRQHSRLDAVRNTIIFEEEL